MDKLGCFVCILLAFVIASYIDSIQEGMENTTTDLVYDPNSPSLSTDEVGTVNVVNATHPPGTFGATVPSTSTHVDHTNKNNDKCPPCPPCARCPEPAFECKKVPNYSRGNSNHLPRPVLTDFSQFGA